MSRTTSRLSSYRFSMKTTSFYLLYMPSQFVIVDRKSLSLLTDILESRSTGGNEGMAEPEYFRNFLLPDISEAYEEEIRVRLCPWTDVGLGFIDSPQTVLLMSNIFDPSLLTRYHYVFIGPSFYLKTSNGFHSSKSLHGIAGTANPKMPEFDSGSWLGRSHRPKSTRSSSRWSVHPSRVF
jgi:hypothetical protein